MSMNLPRTAKDLMRSAGNQERVILENMADPSTAKMTDDVGDFRLTGREENTSKVILSMAEALAAAKRNKR